jgi:hypothetical protein
MAAATKASKPKAESNPVGRPSKYDPMYCDMVEADMAEGYSLTAFAGGIGVSRSTIGEWMAEHPEFSAAVSRSKAKRLRGWEKMGIDIAAKGTGGPGAATIVVFGLKNMGDDEWRDKQEVEHTGLTINVKRFSPEPDAAKD